MQRLDKIISGANGISRNDARAVIRRGGVTVNGATVTDIGFKADENKDVLCVDGKRLDYNEHIYIMMNKPKGVISASSGKNHMTVTDLVPEEMKRRDLFPAGRLDKDTTGFILITDDGELAHNILSPKKHIEKTYIATLDKPINADIIEAFAEGFTLGDGSVCACSRLKAVGNDLKKAEVVLTQGMYHQVKRMFFKFGITVLELERVKMGALALDSSLESGECRLLTPDEVKLLTSR